MAVARSCSIGVDWEYCSSPLAAAGLAAFSFLGLSVFGFFATAARQQNKHSHSMSVTVTSRGHTQT